MIKSGKSEIRCKSYRETEMVTWKGDAVFHTHAETKKRQREQFICFEKKKNNNTGSGH